MALAIFQRPGSNALATAAEGQENNPCQLPNTQVTDPRVFYVLSDFLLWSPMRWGPIRLLIMFSGGIIPLLSFILERPGQTGVARVRRKINATIAMRSITNDATN